jgi:hypothetical protein
MESQALSNAQRVLPITTHIALNLKKMGYPVLYAPWVYFHSIPHPTMERGLPLISANHHCRHLQFSGAMIFPVLRLPHVMTASCTIILTLERKGGGKIETNVYGISHLLGHYIASVYKLIIYCCHSINKHDSSQR